jgi:hypothetical protein
VRERMGASARELAADEHDVERVAELYAAALGDAAGRGIAVSAVDEVQR